VGLNAFPSTIWGFFKRFYGEYLLGGVPLVIVMPGAFVAGTLFPLLLPTGGHIAAQTIPYADDC